MTKTRTTTTQQAQGTPGPPRPTGEPGERLLAVVRGLVIELHPRRGAEIEVRLDAQLDRDLGIDSLGRAELLARVERTFGVALPEDLLATAEAPRDLLDAVLRAAGARPLPEAGEVRTLAPEAAERAPVGTPTMTAVLDWHAEAHPERVHVLLSERGGVERPISYRDLARDAKALARGLRARGLEPGARVAIMLPTCADFFRAFFATLYAGGVPVPIYPPLRMSQIESHLRRQAGILGNSGASVLVTTPEARRLAALLRAHVETLREVVTVPQLRGAADVELPRVEEAGATALIQYTSGSTGDPKGVVLSHANLIANIRAMGETMAACSADAFVSWLPLYHDMGLIGAWLGSLYYAAPAIVLSPLAFLARPERWLWAIHRHRATLSAAPNFGFELCLARIDERSLEGLDLSSLRMVVNGAEPVSPSTIRRFTARFAPYGFRPETLAPVYGLAENAVGLAFPPPGRLPLVDRVRREPLVRRGEAVPAAPGERDALEIVACGHPLPGHQIRIVDMTGREAGERHEGRLQFRGPSATAGYFRNPEKTRALFDGEWLDSGDLAYVAAGDIYITGRVKDIVIRAGRNIYPQEIEMAVGEIEGIRRGCVAVFASPDPASGTERIVVLAESRRRRPDALAELHRRVAEVASDLIGTAPDEVVLAPPRSVPKTSSGKLRRSAARELYERGRIGRRPRAIWLQVLRLSLAGAVPQARRAWRALLALVFAGYWWSVLGAAVGIAWPLVIVLPKRAWRWAVVRAFARLALRLIGAGPAVEGLENLPPAGGIIVSNHASYLDSVVLAAAIPGELTFTAKKELAGQFFAGRALPRLGALFVERDERERGLAETRAAVAVARAGRRLVFFAEGTLTRMPGLLEFRLGGFMTAALSGQPAVPVTLRGTRSILRGGGQWFPRRGSISVEIAPALAPDGDDFAAAIRLRDAARREILGRCGEPDLARETVRPPRPGPDTGRPPAGGASRPSLTE